MPIKADGKVVGVIDVDSTVVETFDDVDKKYLEQMAEQLAKGCDW